MNENCWKGIFYIQLKINDHFIEWRFFFSFVVSFGYFYDHVNKLLKVITWFLIEIRLARDTFNNTFERKKLKLKE